MIEFSFKTPVNLVITSEITHIPIVFDWALSPSFSAASAPLVKSITPTRISIRNNRFDLIIALHRERLISLAIQFSAKENLEKIIQTEGPLI